MPAYRRIYGATSGHEWQMSRPFQHTQRLQQKLLLVLPRDIVIDIVAGHRVEALVDSCQKTR